MSPRRRTAARPVPVAVVQRSGAAGSDLLGEALEAGGLWSVLRSRRASRRCRKADLSIAVKPDLDAFAPGDPTATDPALVEWLVTRLRREGYPNVVLCDGRNGPDGWLHNRDALAVPDLLGYRFEDADGEPYDFAWVADDPRVVPTSAHDRTGALRVCGAWADADVRISFAKAKTDEASGYALGLQNLLGLVSPASPAAAWDAEDRALHLVRSVPAHFALVDAVTASDGGGTHPRPASTSTVIASPSLLLADWAGALKMGADPHASPLNDRVLKLVGLPKTWRLEGETAPWTGWSNPAPTRMEAARVRARWPELDILARAVLQPVDRERFPFRDPLLDQVNATVLSRLGRVREESVRNALGGLLSQVLALAARARAAFVGSVAKGQVRFSEAPLTLDPDAPGAAAYDDTVHKIEAQARALDGVPPDARGFRFRTIGRHIHFGARRVLPLPFDAFVERVDVSAAIRYMNDYVGGSWAVVSADRRGRPLRQAERNVYLPQPNWIGAFGGEPIDVEKLERVDYGPDRHAIWWQTVRSPNGSADSDDGSVMFVRTPAGEVEVHVFARQRFRLPPAVAAARVDRWPRIHEELVSDAYGRFFDGTVANLRAAYAGEPYRIGRPQASADDGADAPDVLAVASGAVALVSRFLGWAPEAGDGQGKPRRWSGAGAAQALEPLLVDERGFAHFPAPDAPTVAVAGREGRAVPLAGADPLTPLTFLAELGRAVGRDLAAAGMRPGPGGGS